MRLTTIGQLTRRYGVSLRTLRYYEQIGLIESIRTDEYAYRTYDEHNCVRLSQIVLLRKLRIPLQQIGELLSNDDATYAIDVFRQNLREIGAQIDALEIIRATLEELIERLNHVRSVNSYEYLLGDDSLRNLIEWAAPPKKEVHTMTDLNEANETLGKLKDVRIVFLPPATVAASHFIGDEPENVAGTRIEEFAKTANIAKIKPDVRLYGFNHPNPVDESNAHGYEFWLTIPDDMEVPAPLMKKRFEGGQYAAHMIQMGNFHEWEWLYEWVHTNGEYVYRGNGSQENMFDSLEEHLNLYTHLVEEGTMPNFTQLDLLIPVRKK